MIKHLVICLLLAWLGWISKKGNDKWVSLKDSSIELEKQSIQPAWYTGNPTNEDQDTCNAIWQNQWFSIPCDSQVQTFCGICQVPPGQNFILRGKYINNIHSTILHFESARTSTKIHEKIASQLNFKRSMFIFIIGYVLWMVR